LLSALSITLSLSVIAIGDSTLPSLAVLFALALLTAHTLRIEPGGVAVLASAFAGIAVALEPIRVGGAAIVFVVVLGLGCFGIAVLSGLYLRWSDLRRVLGEQSARQDERLEIARELHDLVGHYVTGMVVQAQAGRHVAAQNPAAAVDALERIEVAGADAMTA